MLIGSSLKTNTLPYIRIAFLFCARKTIKKLTKLVNRSCFLKIPLITRILLKKRCSMVTRGKCFRKTFFLINNTPAPVLGQNSINNFVGVFIVARAGPCFFISML